MNQRRGLYQYQALRLAKAACERKARRGYTEVCGSVLPGQREIRAVLSRIKRGVLIGYAFNRGRSPRLFSSLQILRR